MDFDLYCSLILNCSLMWFLSVRPEICLHLPSDSTPRWTALVLAVPFTLLGRIGDFHPLATCAARHTTSGRNIYMILPLYCFFIYYSVSIVTITHPFSSYCIYKGSLLSFHSTVTILSNPSPYLTDTTLTLSGISSFT